MSSRSLIMRGVKNRDSNRGSMRKRSSSRRMRMGSSRASWVVPSWVRGTSHRIHPAGTKTPAPPGVCTPSDCVSGK